MNKKSIFVFLFLLWAFIFFTGCKHSGDEPVPTPTPQDSVGDVSVWLTTGNESCLLKKMAPINFSRDFADFTIVIDTTTTYQYIDGFGAALTGSSAHLIHQMSAQNRKKLLDDLFDPEKGIGINYLRITIGSSDFSIGTYSYCDSPDINKFDIPEIDRNELLPVLKEILEINPSMKILASPWSAPAWMKSNNSMYGGSLKGEEVYNDFAEYFVRYVQVFEQEGIHIDALTIQNEPMHETGGYPTMKMLWQEQNKIIRDYLGPKFIANGIQTKIVIWDHNFDMSYYPINILNDPVTRQYVNGTGWHGYGGNASAIDQVTALYPDKETYFTEISGGGWNTDTRMGNMFYYMKDFLMATVNRGSKNFLMWNLALNPQHGPTTTTWGGCQDCRGVVTINENETYIRNEEYYLLGHFAKVVRLGAVRVNNSCYNLPSGMTISSFMNADGSKVVVILNRSGSSRKYNVRCGTRKFYYQQVDESVVSFKF
ncbi:MAG TPA: glycoside hydrolase family 30 beta sandwich domain-containing protein [Paludibacteraceae bacterium]|nr:glycoside hydrolase family 30 beta sandwich domain-containing protein [Paludibacteraceae bacterium]HQG67374.1 glycoside hydrolase family 30 beta sandwich domain-containing protein [Paludibacteraceae bacterium]